jgi:hypothetical protein
MSLLARLRHPLHRDEHELLASWPGDAEGGGRREFEPPLRSPLQVWRLEGRRSRLLGAVSSDFLVLGITVHESGAEFTTLRLGRIALEPPRDVVPGEDAQSPGRGEAEEADAVQQEVDHRAA